MANSLQQPLEGTVHIDEFMVGGAEEQKRGRSKRKNNYSHYEYQRQAKGYLSAIPVVNEVTIFFKYLEPSNSFSWHHLLHRTLVQYNG